MTRADDDARLAAWRRDTPGIAHRNHLNSAGSSLMPRAVVETILDHVRLEAEIGGYEAEAERAAELRAVYESLAALIHCAPEEIALACSATQAFSQAFSTIDWKRGDVLVTSTVDYTSQQILYLSIAERLGVEVVRAPDLPEGGVDPGAVEEILSRRAVRMVAMSWIPTHGGVVQDLAAIGAACRRHGVPYLVDACQAVGQMDVDPKALGCDYLSATGRKFLRGPRGTGFLYASSDATARGDYPLHVDMRGARWVGPTSFELAGGARRFEEWEHSYANVLGLGAAARHAMDVGLKVAEERARALAARVRSWAADTEAVRALDRGSELGAIVTLDLDGLDAPAVVDRLRERRINTSASLQWYGLADLGPRGVASALRVSPHYFNTTGEVDALCAALADMLER